MHMAHTHNGMLHSQDGGGGNQNGKQTKLNYYKSDNICLNLYVQLQKIFFLIFLYNLSKY